MAGELELIADGGAAVPESAANQVTLTISGIGGKKFSTKKIPGETWYRPVSTWCVSSGEDQ